MTPSYSSGWLSAEYFAAIAEWLRCVIQTPLSFATFDVSISVSGEYRSFASVPPFVIQLSLGGAERSLVEKTGARVIASDRCDADPAAAIFAPAVSCFPAGKVPRATPDSRNAPMPITAPELTRIRFKPSPFDDVR
jgi:hypothetical protein